MAAAERVFAELDALPPPPARPAEPGAGVRPARRCGSWAPSFTYPGRGGAGARRRPPDPRARASGSPSSARPAPARRRSRGCSCASTGRSADALLRRRHRPRAASTSTCGGTAWRGCPQRPHLPAATIADAIRLGRPDAERRRRRRGGPDRRRGRLHPRPSGRVRDPGGRRRRGPLGRADAARRARAGAAARRADSCCSTSRRPTSTPTPAEQIAAALARIPRDRTLVLITHDEALAARVADRTVRLEAGGVQAAELRESPA